MEQRFPLSDDGACMIKRVPAILLKNYFVVCFQGHTDEPTAAQQAEIFPIANRYATDVVQDAAAKNSSFTIIYSGRALRRKQAWHLHIIYYSHRLTKAWLYFVLFAKNLLQGLKLR